MERGSIVKSILSISFENQYFTKRAAEQEEKDFESYEEHCLTDVDNGFERKEEK